ncbi:MAG: hypothetical protein IH939_13245 [Acidobacteria bacterium]|nr:hypothetical protein [Acidobacteriota bacterium]
MPTHEVDLPRLAIFSTWGNTQEVGWVQRARERACVDFRGGKASAVPRRPEGLRHGVASSPDRSAARPPS